MATRPGFRGFLLLLLPLDDQHHFGDGSVVHMREDAQIYFYLYLYDPLRLFETREEMGGTT